MRFPKRATDVVVAMAALFLAAPLLVVVGLAVRFYDRGPILLRQERVGRDGRPFVLLKIRSMRRCAGKGGPLVTSAGDRRVTRIGRWLRRTKIDELPQLWNVLRGEMSLVGPRPEVRRFVDLYTAEQREVLGLTPGLTDPASITYRDEEQLLARCEDPERYYVEVVMPAKIEMSLRYARNANGWTDLGVLLRTAAAILGIG